MTIPARPDKECHEFCGSCPMPKMHYYRHMRTDQDHPDDQFDDSDILKENLRHVRGRLADKERDLQAADAMVAEMRGEIERQGELLERWIEVFDMQMNEDGNWLFDSAQTELWEKHAELLDEFNKLLRDWNRFVPKYNAVVADQPLRGRGRPRAASEAQEAEVLRLKNGGASYSVIVAATGLSAKTVRTIVTAPQKAERERRKLKKRILNREAAARYRARTCGRALIEKEVNESAKRQAKLIKAAKGLER